VIDPAAIHAEEDVLILAEGEEAELVAHEDIVGHSELGEGAAEAIADAWAVERTNPVVQTRTPIPAFMVHLLVALNAHQQQWNAAGRLANPILRDAPTDRQAASRGRARSTMTFLLLPGTGAIKAPTQRRRS
jgi:hypothetical protein